MGGRLLRPCSPPHVLLLLNVCALPTCRGISGTRLMSGTLPKAWSAMTSLTLL
jgi:hypothetical protein